MSAMQSERSRDELLAECRAYELWQDSPELDSGARQTVRGMLRDPGKTFGALFGATQGFFTEALGYGDEDARARGKPTTFMAMSTPLCRGLPKPPNKPRTADFMQALIEEYNEKFAQTGEPRIEDVEAGRFEQRMREAERLGFTHPLCKVATMTWRPRVLMAWWPPWTANGRVELELDCCAEDQSEAPVAGVHTSFPWFTREPFTESYRTSVVRRVRRWRIVLNSDRLQKLEDAQFKQFHAAILAMAESPPVLLSGLIDHLWFYSAGVMHNISHYYPHIKVVGLSKSKVSGQFHRISDWEHNVDVTECKFWTDRRVRGKLKVAALLPRWWADARDRANAPPDANDPKGGLGFQAARLEFESEVRREGRGGVPLSPDRSRSWHASPTTASESAFAGGGLPSLVWLKL